MTDFDEIGRSEDFQILRKRFRSFAFPMTAVFMVWYFVYVLLSMYAKDFMASTPWGGDVNIGHMMGLLQFVTTFAITALYIRHANTKLDPLVEKVCASAGIKKEETV